MQTLYESVLGQSSSANKIMKGIKDKDYGKQFYIQQMLNKTLMMFEYKNLPETLPKYYLELYLQVFGGCIIAEVSNNLYCLFGNSGGRPGPYYFPQEFIVANPYLDLTKTYKINEDCVLCKNDHLLFGLLPIFDRWSRLLVENDITLFMIDINLRAPSLFAAGDDRTKVSFEEFIKKLEKGDLGVIGDNAFLDSIRTFPLDQNRSGNTLTSLIEYHQYLKSGWMQDVGLNSNYNMKRERLAQDEIGLNVDALLPLIDNMDECRHEFVKGTNDMFGSQIEVDLSSSWKKIKKEAKLAVEPYHVNDSIGNNEQKTYDQEENNFIDNEQVEEESSDTSSDPDDVSEDIRFQIMNDDGPADPIDTLKAAASLIEEASEELQEEVNEDNNDE